jgi:hypothetical protein
MSYAMRTVDSASGIPPRAELAMWLRVRVAYMALVLALRWDGGQRWVIHSRAKVPTVSVVSLAG